MLDDGRLTDGQGRTVDFRNTVIIMTSNLGSQIIAELAGTGDEAADAARGPERPPGRVPPRVPQPDRRDDHLPPAGDGGAEQIVDIQLQRLQTQLAEAGLTIEISDEAKDRLAEEGFDPAYGARPLKRVIQQRLANPLATALLEQKVIAGDTVEIGWDGRRRNSPSRPFVRRPRRPETAARPGRPRPLSGPLRSAPAGILCGPLISSCMPGSRAASKA